MLCEFKHLLCVDMRSFFIALCLGSAAAFAPVSNVKRLVRLGTETSVGTIPIWLGIQAGRQAGRQGSS